MIKFSASRTNYASVQGRGTGAVLSHLAVVGLRCSVCACLLCGPKPCAMHNLFLNTSTLCISLMLHDPNVLFSAFSFSRDWEIRK